MSGSMPLLSLGCKYLGLEVVDDASRWMGFLNQGSSIHGMQDRQLSSPMSKHTPVRDLEIESGLGLSESISRPAIKSIKYVYMILTQWGQ